MSSLSGEILLIPQGLDGPDALLLCAKNHAKRRGLLVSSSVAQHRLQMEKLRLRDIEQLFQNHQGSMGGITLTRSLVIHLTPEKGHRSFLQALPGHY